jgi:hypothetical protein
VYYACTIPGFKQFWGVAVAKKSLNHKVFGVWGYYIGNFTPTPDTTAKYYKYKYLPNKNTSKIDDTRQDNKRYLKKISTSSMGIRIALKA